MKTLKSNFKSMQFQRSCGQKTKNEPKQTFAGILSIVCMYLHLYFFFLPGKLGTIRVL